MGIRDVLKTRQWSGQKSSRSRHASLQPAVFSPVEAAHGNRQVFCPTVEVAQHRVLDAHALEVVNRPVHTGRVAMAEMQRR
jgi:hypothetical protein